MSFQDLSLKHTYNSENDNMLDDFYIPVLKEAVIYKRITGFFSSSSFRIASPGILEFIRKKGKMQFILNVRLNSDDYDAIQSGLNKPEEIINELLFTDLKKIETELSFNHSKVLGWMIANRYLEIKIGYIETKHSGSEILHQKVGILEDSDGNIISFSGSNNESAYGWEYNSEKFKAFFSWEDGNQIFIEPDITDFKNLWINNAKKTRVISFPKAIEDHLIQLAPESIEKFEESLEEAIIENFPENKIKKKSAGFSFRNYQKEAISKWFENDGKGLFEMATGTGKTFTALGILQELLKKEEKLITIISCPYLHISKQWEKSIHTIGIDIPIYYASSIDTKWREKIQGAILDVKLGKIKQFIILTTHDSIGSKKFIGFMQDASKKNIPLFLIGDEIHGMGSSTRLEGLIPDYKYRLGLSATPKRYMDEYGTGELMDYFDKIVYEFNLNRAINEINPETGESYLSPYEYYPIFVDLKDEDMENYSKLSQEIAILFWKSKKSKKEQDKLEKKLRDRQDILRNAETKYPAYANLLSQLIKNNQLNNTLIYCSPQQIEQAQLILREEGNNKIIQHRFTSKEDSTRKQVKYNNMTEREFLLHNFDIRNYNVLFAIRCLDEGVDVPSTRIAILLSSSGNPKEYIQRRGRVLRRFPGKKKAIIFDITALPNPLDSRLNPEMEKKIVEKQLKRLEEFAKDALNANEIEREIFKIRNKFEAYGDTK